MADADNRLEAVRYVRAKRITTAGAEPREVSEEICVAAESTLSIDVEGVEDYTILCTPTDRQALVVGFLFTEGLIEQYSDIEVLKPCEDRPATIRVRLRGQVPRIGDAGRNLLIASSCGACGSENLAERIEGLPRVGNSLKLAAGLLRSVSSRLRDRQVLFTASGGTHGAALFDSRGEIVSLAEDTGRHNALDKAIGKCLQGGQPTAGKAVVLTSRLSLEMVGKCARSGIELVAAVSAPTSLAIEVADRCNITLCAFVRGQRATLFTHPERVLLG